MTFDLAGMIADREAGTPDKDWSLGDYPNHPVPMSGACISHYSRGAGGSVGEANSSRFLRLPAVEAEVIRQRAEILRLTARVAALDTLVQAVDEYHNASLAELAMPTDRGGSSGPKGKAIHETLAAKGRMFAICAALSTPTEEPKT